MKITKVPVASNCFIYALRKFIREGGYLLIRKSHSGVFPHALWCKNLGDLEVEQYVPADRVQMPWAIFHKLFFRGKVLTKDSLNDDGH